MLFPSPLFLFYFLPLVLAVYYLSPVNWRNTVLLLASLIFYAAGEAWFLGVMLLSIAFNYVVGRCIAGERYGRLALVLGITGNLLLLGWFKYANFIADNLAPVFIAFGLQAPVLAPVHLPLGISFFTFQAMSYLVDVRRGAATPCRSLGQCGLYIALFPQLIAGPIVRYHEIATQLVQRRVDSDLLTSGARRFIIGLAKKMLLANPLGALADTIFATPAAELSPAMAWTGALLYGLQIYFDFSAYSDMAIGLGRLFGFRFPENFNYPYAARSIREFWRRWHMSLSRWFRDYLYIPLGGNRLGSVRTMANLLTVFLLCGLWHGASWNFVIWGALHGSFLALERGPWGRWIGSCWRPLRHLYVLVVVTSAWVFFRLESLPDALAYLKVMYGFGHGTPVAGSLQMLFGVEQWLVLGVALILSTPLYRHCARRWWIPLGQRSVAVYALEHAVLLALLLLALLSVAASVYNPFIYFRF